MNTSLFSKTPTVTVLDNRGLAVREIVYHRHPGTPDVTDERITRHRYDARGVLTQSADPRLHAAGRANFTYQTDLADNVLRTQSADAGISVALNDAAGRPFMAVTNIGTDKEGKEDRSQAVTRTWQYEGNTLPGRLLGVTGQVSEEAARVTERFIWAGNTEDEQKNNLAGQCVSHYDTAGLVQTNSIALSGVPLSVTRRLLKDAGNAETVATWQGEDVSAWNTLLEPETEAHTTLTTADATGAVMTATDAAGNLQRVAYDVAGLLKGSWLRLPGGPEQVIVKSLTYSAAGQKLREEHGNGVVTTYAYEAETQRLMGIKTERPAGHAAGAKVLQDLRYDYDPVGNVLSVRNDAEETRFWRNQKVVPENTYTYDSLYQLVSATGREMANAGQQSSNLPPLSSFDNATYTNYTRTYTCDAAGNLTQIQHSAPATNNSYTTDITVSDRSNRAVLSTLTDKPAEVETLFMAGGQQTALLPGQARNQTLAWTACGELRQVILVPREDAADDSESYRYDSNSQRILKVSTQQTAGSTQTHQVLYLPGLELRTVTNGSTVTESLQVITVGEAGRAQVRVLHRESRKPAGIANDQIRYSYDNLTGSSVLEVDGDGNLISQEEYYPYGGTAVWTVRSQVEADYKTIRYSGKERDATGLYYYGYRYYQPWAGRWLSADPAGTVDGLNLFRMVRDNPVTLHDPDGRMPVNNPSVQKDDDSKLLQSYLQRRRVAVGIPRLDEIAGQPAAVSQAEQSASLPSQMPGWRPGRRRGAIGIDNAAPSASYNTATADVLKAPPALLMVKEEALEDKAQIKKSSFVNLMEKRGEYRITVRNGKLLYKGQLLTTNESGRFKFIQDHDGTLYGVEASDDPEGIKHSSLIGTKWPISAGTISAHEGDIVQLTSSSGHFRPSKEHLSFTENYLRSKEVSIMQVNPFFGQGGKTRRVNRDVASYVRKYMS